MSALFGLSNRRGEHVYASNLTTLPLQIRSILEAREEAKDTPSEDKESAVDEEVCLRPDCRGLPCPAGSMPDGGI